MHHFFEAITNTAGDSLIGYFARVINRDTQNTVTLSSDENGTPIVVVSGVENMAKSDDYGNLSLYVEPGTYHLDIYAPNTTTFLFRVSDVAMSSDKGEKGDTGSQGDVGESDASFVSLAALQAIDPTAYPSPRLAAPSGSDSGVVNGLFSYQLGNFTGRTDVVVLNSIPITTGALVRQSGDSISFSIVAPRRTVAAKLRETPSIIDFGAVPDYNPGDGTGTDSLSAINAAMQYVAGQGGGDLLVPPAGTFKVSGPILPGNKVTLRGCSSVIGGAGSIWATGSELFTFPSTLVLNLDNVSFIGSRGVTDIAIREAGLWAYGHVTRCYFANFREWDQVLLGMHASENTFQNLCKVHHGGSDNEFSKNYIQYDTDETYLGADDVFWQWEAMSASSFHHNYLTCLGQADIDPTVFDLNLSNRVRVKDNQFDGGRFHTMRISSATHSCDFDTNRLSSQSSASDTLSAAYVPIVIRENLMDVKIDRTWCQGLKPSVPFISAIGGMKRIEVSNTKFADGFSDESLHDITSTSDTGRIIITGPAHPRSTSLPDGTSFRSWHFNRLLTNAGQVDGLLVNNLDIANMVAGDIINCRVADDTKRWIITSSAGNIYDSNVNTGKRSFRIICIVNGEPILDY